MRKPFLLATLVIVLVVAIWYGAQRSATPTRAPQVDSAATQYVFEAQGVLLRQMDAAGNLQFEVEAQHIAQLPEGGGLLATTLTLYHDPPGATPGGPQRWTLRAREGRLPQDGRIVSLSGDVRAEGQPAGFRSPIRLKTSALDFDLDRQIVTAADEVDFVSGSYSGSGHGLQVNIEAGVITLGAGHAKIVL